MRWNVLFTEPFALADGRRIDCLGDVHQIMQRLPARHRRNAHWQRANALVFKAAERGNKNAVVEARAQLEHALKAEGLI